MAISTTEAEYVSTGIACQQALWMKQALVDYDIKLDDIPVLCDNKGVIDLSKNPVLHSRTKHIEIRHHFLRDNVQKGNISIEKVSSEDNIADTLTKPLKREPFNLLRLDRRFPSLTKAGSILQMEPAEPAGQSPGISSSHLLNTPKTTPQPLSSPPPAPSKPSKQNSSLAINLDPVELIFSTPPTSPHPFFDSLENLPARTTNPPPPQPSFETIERLVNQPPPLPAIEPPLLPLPPQLLPLGPNNPFPLLTHEMFCDHCQRTQVIINDLRKEMRFILNHILQCLDVLSHKNHP
ncbi:hypothetical protein Tco_1271431 [Tanacetum coccineum]